MAQDQDVDGYPMLASGNRAEQLSAVSGRFQGRFKLPRAYGLRTTRWMPSLRNFVQMSASRNAGAPILFDLQSQVPKRRDPRIRYENWQNNIETDSRPISVPRRFREAEKALMVKKAIIIPSIWKHTRKFHNSVLRSLLP